MSALHDDVVYGALLLFSVAFGWFFKGFKGNLLRQITSAGIGFCFVLLVCRWHFLHSFVTIMGNCCIIKLSPNIFLRITLFNIYYDFYFLLFGFLFFIVIFIFYYVTLRPRNKRPKRIWIMININPNALHKQLSKTRILI